MIVNMYVDRGNGRIAVKVEGSGPLILCVPGMGESMASFRHLLPSLVVSGYQVATMDLRGHGASSVGFNAYDGPAAATDILAVIAALERSKAVVIGNSMGAAAAVLAATAQPDVVNALVLIGPFLRDHGSAVKRMLMQLALVPPWGPIIWEKYYRSLFGQQRPDDHENHVQNTLAMLRRPGRWAAFQRTAQTSHAKVESSLPRVSARSLVIMGDQDPDFPDPEAEAVWAAKALGGTYQMVAGAGHYPMSEQPEAIRSMVMPFLDQAFSPRAKPWLND